MSDAVEVALDLDGETVQVGVAYFHRRRGTVTTDFAYDPAYLANPAAYAIDPSLPMDAGRGVVDGLPGAFSDCAPDRWGRRLINRRIRAEEGTATPRSLSDLDYLLGVSDLTRQGALHFRVRGETEFADPSTDVPKAVRLPELMRAAAHVARDDSSASANLSAIKILLNAGTGTLGGARPKASVIGDDGLLYIAKFPHPSDEWDVMAWERTALELAERAGIDVPRTQIVKVDGRTVLLLERFDRRQGQRVGYVSAMTMVQSHDGDGSRDYVDVGAELSDMSARADDDLSALWRRVALSVAIHNTDDHLRNHGLLRSEGGWRLSPAFDINPNPDLAEERSTSIGGATSRSDELDGLMLSARDFGLSETAARTILGEVFSATRQWRQRATSNGIPESDLKRFESVFEGLRADVEQLALS
jgi:serine/threonine-protein kinase HipA